jgi:drug/metabolite transporter (DMT)-like permease
MIVSIGIMLAIGALVFWGIGDFLIQRCARIVGSIETMLLIGLAMMLMATPFAYGEIFATSFPNLLLLIATGIVLTGASLFDFEALRSGKMAVAEPVVGLETPFTVIFAVLLTGEHVTLGAAFLIGLIFLGTTLIVTKRIELPGLHKRVLEKGVRFAFFAAIGLAFSNLLVGEASREVSALAAVWWVGAVHVAFCVGYLIRKKRLAALVPHVLAHPVTLLSQALTDSLAWFSFAGAMLYAPISIVAAVSSGYIALAVFLGIIVTREKVRLHQGIGIAVVTLGIAVLSYLYG